MEKPHLFEKNDFLLTKLSGRYYSQGEIRKEANLILKSGNRHNFTLHLSHYLSACNPAYDDF